MGVRHVVAIRKEVKVIDEAADDSWPLTPQARP